MAGIVCLNNPVLIVRVLAGVIHPISTAEEATDIPEMSVTERGPVNSTARCVEMFVFLHVNSFVGCHAKMGNLVDLAGEEEEAPGEGEELGGCQEEYGGPAGSEAGETREAGGVRGTGTFSSREILVQTPLTPSLDQDHQQEEDNKVPVVFLGDTVAHPGTVMVEGADTAVTPRTVLRPNRLNLQTSPTEPGRLQYVLRLVSFDHLNQLHQPPHLLRLAGFDKPGVETPTPEVAVPDGNSEEDNG